MKETDTIETPLDRVYNARKKHARSYLDNRGDPLKYWSTLQRCGLLFITTVLNESDLLLEMVITINSDKTKEQLCYKVDGDTRYTVIHGASREIMPITEGTVLYLLRTLFAELSREMTEAEFYLSLGIAWTQVAKDRNYI